MKIQYTVTQFKAALKRNAGKDVCCFFRMDNNDCIRTMYLQTKKALILCNLTCVAERVSVYKLAKDLGYLPFDVCSFLSF